MLVTLAGTVAGLDRIEVEGQGNYASPLVVGAGRHVLRFRAVDTAGNAEAWQALTIDVDGTPPVASASVKTERGIALVTLSAVDSGGEVDRIEYRSDGADALIYAKPLAFTEAGIHGVAYRAVDLAGNASAWQTAEAYTEPWRPSAGYLVFATGPTGQEIPSYLPTHRYMPLYSDTVNRHWDYTALAQYLPGYATLGEAALLSKLDRGTPGGELMRFYALKASVSYAFVKNGSSVPGWFKLATGVALNEEYFPGGADLYLRRNQAGELVVVPGDAAHTGSPFVVTVEQTVPQVRIVEPARQKSYAPLEILRLRVQAGQLQGEGRSGKAQP